MNNAVLVTGAAGQLGSELSKSCKNLDYENIIFCDRLDLDLMNYKNVEEFLVDNEIGVIVNCAAFTDVEGAEDKSDEADSLNHKAVKNLANISIKLDLKVIHISTDYVFGGDQSKPYTEESEVNPLNVYGLSKFMGEKSLLEINPENIVIRTSWFYSEFGNNFVKTILRLGEKKDSLNVVVDQIGTPTCAKDLAELIVSILANEKYKVMNGIYHYSNEGVASWYDFAMAIVDLAGLRCEINPVLSNEYDAKARRPHYSVLNKNKIKKELNINIPYWRDSLKNVIDTLV